MQFRRWLPIFIAAAVVILVIVYGLMPKPVAVDTAVVRRAPLRMTVEAEGKTRVRDRYIVSAPVSAYMRRIAMEAGDQVQPGQILAVFDPAPSNPLDQRSYTVARAGVASAEAVLKAEEEKVQAAQIDADYAARSLERTRKLFESKVVSQDVIEQATAAATRARAALLSARAAVGAAKAELDRAHAAVSQFDAQDSNARKAVSVYAPVTGRVLRMYRESQGLVQAGEPLIEIGDPRNIEVVVEVLSTDAVRMKPGTRVIFERWGGDSELAGSVRVVEPAGFTKISSLGVEEQRVQVIVDFTSDSSQRQRLGDGYRLEASFILWESDQVLQVPESAMFHVNGRWAVFAIENGRAFQRELRIGHRTGLTAEVLDGLSEGQPIIAHPDNAIENGVRVQPREKD